MKTITNNQYVSFDCGRFFGNGFARGIAISEQPVLGRGIIVEVDGDLTYNDTRKKVPSEWDCIVVFEVHLKNI